MNDFLSAVKAKLQDQWCNAEVHVVIGNEACDLDSAVSAMTYAYYLHSKNKDENTIVVPVLNIVESQFRLRTETTHFFKKLNIQQKDLLFKDQIDLGRLHSEGRLTVTLVDHNVLTGTDTQLEDCVVEIIDHHVRERWKDDKVKEKLDFVGSCCTLVAEELLNDSDFCLDEITAELLYGTVLVDTINRSPEAGKITPRDEVVLRNLEAVIPNVKGDNLFRELQAAKFDISDLLNMEILEKDLKMVTGTAMTIAMSSVTMDMKELLERPNFKHDLDEFCQKQNCEVVVIMTLVNNEDGKPQRQVAVYSQNRIFRDQIADTLDNSEDVDLELELEVAPFDDISVYQQGNVKASRKKVMPILKSFLHGDITPDVSSKDFVTQHSVAAAAEGFSHLIVGESDNTSDKTESHVKFTLESLDSPSVEEEASEPERDVGSYRNFDTVQLDSPSRLDTSHTVHVQQMPSHDYEILIKAGKSGTPYEKERFSQNPYSEINSSSGLFSSAHSSNLFDLGISDSELVDPFSSVEDSAKADSFENSPKEKKQTQSVDNEVEIPEETEVTKETEVRSGDESENVLGDSRNPFLVELQDDNTETETSAQNENPFMTDNKDIPDKTVNFQLKDFDDNASFEKDDLGDVSFNSSGKFMSENFLNVNALDLNHPPARKSASLIVECDAKSQADDLAELEESELFDKILTPDQGHSGESSPFAFSGVNSPFINSYTGTPYHSRTASDSGAGLPDFVVPPNSLMDQGFVESDTDRRLPSFNSAEMVERIHQKKASLGTGIDLLDQEENIGETSTPYTPQNSYREEGMFLPERRENSLPNLMDSEILEKVQQKRDSLSANLRTSESDHTDVRPTTTNPFGNFFDLSNTGVEENVQSTNPFLQASIENAEFDPFAPVDPVTDTNCGTVPSHTQGQELFGGLAGFEQKRAEHSNLDILDIFGESDAKSIQNQSENKNGFEDLLGLNTDLGLQTEAVPAHSLNPFLTDIESICSNDESVGCDPMNQSSGETRDTQSTVNMESVDQSTLEALNESANLEAADAVSETLAKEIIHDAIESFPDFNNPLVASEMIQRNDVDWTDQGSGDSGIGSTGSPQQGPKVQTGARRLVSDYSVETEYLPSMDPLHGSLNITSNSSRTQSIETDADKEVVEGESFRKVSGEVQDPFIPELLSTHNKTFPPKGITENLREMIIAENIETAKIACETSSEKEAEKDYANTEEPKRETDLSSALNESVSENKREELEVNDLKDDMKDIDTEKLVSLSAYREEMFETSLKPESCMDYSNEMSAVIENVKDVILQENIQSSAIDMNLSNSNNNFVDLPFEQTETSLLTPVQFDSEGNSISESKNGETEQEMISGGIHFVEQTSEHSDDSNLVKQEDNDVEKLCKPESLLDLSESGTSETEEKFDLNTFQKPENNFSEFEDSVFKGFKRELSETEFENETGASAGPDVKPCEDVSLEENSDLGIDNQAFELDLSDVSIEKDSESMIEENIENKSRCVAEGENIGKDSESVVEKENLEKDSVSMLMEENIERESESIFEDENIEKDSESLFEDENIEKDSESMIEDENINKDSKNMYKEENIEKFSENMIEEENIEKDSESMIEEETDFESKECDADIPVSIESKQEFTEVPETASPEILMSESGNSISSDSSSSIPTTSESESELITVRENTKGEEQSVIEDADIAEITAACNIGESANFTGTVVETGMPNTGVDFFEGGRVNIVQNDNENTDTEIVNEQECVEVHSELENPRDIGLEEKAEIGNTDNDLTGNLVVINEPMTESSLTIASVSSVETALGDHASGFYEVNPESVGSSITEDLLTNSNFETNLGENETGFYEFNQGQDALVRSADSVDTVSSVETPDHEKVTDYYEVNAEKLELAIEKDNKNFLDIDENYSDASVSPLETPETETAKGFYDINADNLEKAIERIDSLDLNNSLRVESTLSDDSSISPMETPELEAVGGFYEFESNFDALNSIRNTGEDAELKPLGPSDAPEINIELVGSIGSSKDSFDSETEPSFEMNDTQSMEEERKVNEEVETKPELQEQIFPVQTLNEISEASSTMDQTNDKDNYVNESEDVSERQSGEFDIAPKITIEMLSNTGTGDINDSTEDGFSEIDAEIQGTVLQNIEIGNAFSPVESPSEEVFSMGYEINPMVPDLRQNSIQSSEEEYTEKSSKPFVRFCSDLNEREVDDKVEEMADALVGTALVEAIDSLQEQYTKKKSKDNEEAECVQPAGKNCDSEKYMNIADELVNEAITSAIELVQEIRLNEDETFITSEIASAMRESIDSSDSEMSSTTTEGSYRIVNSVDLSPAATPDREEVASPDLEIGTDERTEDVIFEHKDISTCDKSLIYKSDYVKENVTNEFNDVSVDEKETELKVTLDMTNDASFMNDENGNITEEIQEYCTNIDSVSDAVSEDIAENKKVDDSELNDEGKEENKARSFVRQETMIPDIVVSTEETPPSSDDNEYFLKEVSTKQADYVNEVVESTGPVSESAIIVNDKDLKESEIEIQNNETEVIKSLTEVKSCQHLDEEEEEEDMIEKESCVSKAEITEQDTEHFIEQKDDTLYRQEVLPDIVSFNEILEKQEPVKLSQSNEEDTSSMLTSENESVEITSETSHDNVRDIQVAQKRDEVPYHNIKDLESEKEEKRSARPKTGKTEYVTRKEIFYTSAGRMSISIDSVVDPPSDSEHGYLAGQDIIHEETHEAVDVSRILARTDSAIYHADEVLSHDSDVSLLLENENAHKVQANFTDLVADESSACEDDDDTLSNNSQPVDDDDDGTSEKHVVIEKVEPDRPKPSHEKMKMEETQEWHEDPIPGMGADNQDSSTDESDTESDSEYTKPARPDSLLNGTRRKKKIAANNFLSPDSTDDLVEGVDDIPTPDDLETPSDIEGEGLEWEAAGPDDTPITPTSDSKKFAEYQDDEAEREKYENTKFRKVEIAGKDYRVDMKVIEPYKKVLSHGGYYGDGLNAIILFCGCYLPDRGRSDYQYVMDNLFLYVISTLELLVAEDYMIVYFHGATPRRQMPSFGWLKRCYQMIDRRLRKNLKALLMVHPTLWLKTVVMMTKPFISSKFSSKLRFVKTLQELGKIVPMEYIYVPDPVSQYDARLTQHRPCTSAPATPSSPS